MFSAFNPSKCTHLEQWAADCETVPGSSRGLPAGAGIHNLGLPRVFKSNSLSIRPTTALIKSIYILQIKLI